MFRYLRIIRWNLELNIWRTHENVEFLYISGVCTTPLERKRANKYVRLIRGWSWQYMGTGFEFMSLYLSSIVSTFWYYKNIDFIYLSKWGKLGSQYWNVWLVQFTLEQIVWLSWIKRILISRHWHSGATFGHLRNIYYPRDN